MKSIPIKFKEDHLVFDFGCFVERILFKKLNIAAYGLLLFGSKEEFPTNWLESTRRYSSLELGKNIPILVWLKRSYLKKVVDTGKFIAPTDHDILKLKKSDKIIVYREQPFRGYRGKCGFEA